MKTYLPLIPAAAAAALLLPLATGGRSSRAEATEPVQPECSSPQSIMPRPSGAPPFR
jgi:hypothetical protein